MYPLYSIEAVFVTISRCQNDILLYGSFGCFHWPDALPSANSLWRIRTKLVAVYKPTLHLIKIVINCTCTSVHVCIRVYFMKFCTDQHYEKRIVSSTVQLFNVI